MPVSQMKWLRLCREGVPRSQIRTQGSGVPLHTPVGLAKMPPAAGQGHPIDALRRSAPHAWPSPMRFFPLPLLPTSKMAAGGADQVRDPARASAVPVWTL